jgi:flagellar basal-body rod protein FlgB
MLGTEPIFAALSSALDTAALRQSVHVSNIANASVAGYEPLTVATDPLAAQGFLPIADAGSALGINFGGSAVVASGSEAVALDQEMAQMAQNAIRYQALVGAVERTASLLRLAIKEGREG